MMSKLPMVTAALVAALGVLLCHCGKTVDPDSDAGITGDATVDVSTSNDAGIDGRTSDASRDANSSFDAAPPVVSCAMNASACDSLPPSTCADATTVLFFSDGACDGGTCTWKTRTMPCGAQSYCFNGGCTPPTTK